MASFTFYPQNKNARIKSRVSRNGKFRTETIRRDFGTMNMAVSTDPNTKATRCAERPKVANSSRGAWVDGPKSRGVIAVAQT